MSKLVLHAVGVAALFSLVSGCDNNRYPSVELAAEENTPYRLILRTFKDGEYADQPFWLSARPSGGTGIVDLILRSEQCKNVDVFQEPRDLTIFYDELELREFSGSTSYSFVPRPLLCDNRNPVCQALRREKIKRGVSAVPICTYR